MRKEILFGLKSRQISVLLLVFISMLCVNTRQAFATHAAGADLTYRFISHSDSLGDIYEVTCSFYRDCGGSPAPGNLVVTFVSDCFPNNPFVQALQLEPNTGQEITFPCSTSATKCTNPNSPVSGFQKYVYKK